MKIQRIAVNTLYGSPGKRRCDIRVADVDYSFPFVDIVGFSDGVQDILAHAERLVPVNAVRPEDRTFMQLEGLHVQDSVEHNRNMVSAREVRERNAGGEHVAGGDWYAEISLNGTDTDCTFSTLPELFEIVQSIIKRELANSGSIIVQTPAILAHAQ